jgi:hypothetical protein
MKPISRFLVQFGCIIGAFCVTACVFPLAAKAMTQQPDPATGLAAKVAERKELAVLFVGNSYSFGVPRAFEKAAKARGKAVRTGHATTGGWTLAQHAESAATLRKIREGRWDIVVFQEQSQIPALSAGRRAALMRAPLRALIAAARATGAIPVLYQTWGRRDGDFMTMNARLRTGYQAAAKAAGGMVIVPVGDAWEKEVTAGRGAELFMPDGSHPTPVANQLIATAFCDSFFGK